MILAFAIIACIYSLLILAFSYSWREDDKMPALIPDENQPKVSVIVAFRNEEKKISALVKSLLSQTYKNLEFIFVDDHSEDNSVEILKTFSDSRLKLLSLDDDFGKKAALRYGYENSSGEILYFTDADCIIKPDCIALMIAEMKTRNYSMICGPVCFANGKGFWNKLFQLEFLSLTGSGAAGFFMNKPFMCNGANFAVEREVYKSADLNTKYSSGDDVFLLHYAHKNHKVGFAQFEECIVETESPKNISQFFAQRIRWASKVGGYKNKFAVFVSFVVFLMSLTLITAFVFSCIEPVYSIVFGCLFFMKLAIDIYFIVPVLKFYNRRKLSLLILPLTILHPLYVVSVALLSLFWKPKWKGRFLIKNAEL